MKNKIYIGCAGFSNRDWNGYFFPENLPAKEQLNYYSTEFNAVEINSTFYRRPRLSTLENWYQSTPEDFKFFIKIPKTITHIKRVRETAAETLDFCHHIYGGIKEKLAGFLFQLPPSFHNTEENLQNILDTVPPDFLNVVEFRHKSWWTEEIQEILKKNGIVFAGVSFPKDIPDDFIINHDELAYYRLHGVPVLFKSEYPAETLDAMAKEAENSNRTVFIFFNNTWGTAAIKNGLYLNELTQ